MRNWRIYGRHGKQRTFKAMNLKEGCQTGNLIYASMLTEAEKEKVMAEIVPQNPDWTFETRRVPDEQAL